MPSDLLTCTICAKSQRFSDVSHLLTHIGSKGHLANLHSLQVLSHQERDAGLKLSIYNAWFQEHGMASLLSERMQQKEEKKATKKAVQQARLSSTPGSNAMNPQKSRKSRKTFKAPIAVAAYELQPLTIKRSESEVELNSASFTTPRQSSYPALESSPPKRESDAFEVNEDALPTLSDENLSPSKYSPGAPQLKGEKYPGMHLFDAAPEAQRRKRNQKKDSSVLRQLEHNASLVVPTEVVHSSAGLGYVLKRRSMDDLENDSPVEGEEPLPTPAARKKRVTRAPWIKEETKQDEKKKKKPKRRGRPRKQLETPTQDTSSAVEDDAQLTSHYSPTVDEDRDFKPTVRNAGRKKRKNAFIVYQDLSPSFGVDGSSEMMPAYVDADIGQTQLMYPPPAWQKQQIDLYDSFKLVSDRYTTYANSADASRDKENINPLLTNITGFHQEQSINPLAVHSVNHKDGPNSSIFGGRIDHHRTHGSMLSHDYPPAPLGVQHTFEVSAGPFAGNDAFMSTRNPLMAALEKFNTPTKHEAYGYDGFQNDLTPRYRQPLFAP
ncbi:hypothetical protein LTR64_005608 [Lithohypha guttulata]|uniref:uncharacterized protein n=1 Tax=Lithohypha guttulata TaxID=1690604 RepID=UPI002DE18E7F|nr:hypothetical protein LTR51_002597 [Lithohypha guttulata]